MSEKQDDQTTVQATEGVSSCGCGCGCGQGQTAQQETTDAEEPTEAEEQSVGGFAAMCREFMSGKGVGCCGSMMEKMTAGRGSAQPATEEN